MTERPSGRAVPRVQRSTSKASAPTPQCGEFKKQVCIGLDREFRYNRSAGGTPETALPPPLSGQPSGHPRLQLFDQ